MKKSLIVFAACLLSAGIALDASAAGAKTKEKKRETVVDSPAPARSSKSHGSQNMAGCGLGSMVIADNSKWAQVGASFLNGTGFQTFGISFGTSNCTEDGVASAARARDAFVESNLADLRRDISTGRGEYLSSLASFYGCGAERLGDFGSALRLHEAEIRQAAPEQASRVIDSAVNSEKADCRIQG